MSSVPFSVAFGLLLTAGLLKNLKAVPVPTTTLPPLPARRYLEPFDKDPFKDYQDYQDASKRTLAQQAIENAKKFPRPWGMPPIELFDNSFFNPNPFKEQEPRNILETNSIQPTYYDGFFPEDDFSVEEEENNFLEPPYPGDSNYLVEPPQLTYVEQPMLNTYQPNNGYSNNYGSNEQTSKEESETDAEVEKENSAEEGDDFDNGGNLITTSIPQPPPQIFIPNNMFPQKPPQYFPKTTMNTDYDSVEVDMKPRQREFRSVKPAIKTNYTPPPLPPPPPQLPSPPPEPKSKLAKDTKVVAVEDLQPVIEKKPTERELFSRTTTTTKTTTWYINENNEIVVKENSDEKPSPIRGKYTKTSKTTTSGPVPWYLQGFEDVIFEEENEKSKTILDKIKNLKGMTPTSITSFTNAPNPWSTEINEEVVLEEVITKKESNNDAKSTSHSSPLELIVDYLPRTQLSEEVNSIEKAIIEEIVEFLEEEEGILEISILPDLPPFFPPAMPPGKQFPPFQFPMHQIPPPTITLADKDSHEEEFFGQGNNFQDNAYVTEMPNGINQNQVTTQKPLTTAQPMETTFSPLGQMGTLQAPEQQMYPQPNYNYPQPTQHPQLYGNNRREKWGSQMGDDSQADQGRIQARLEQDRRDKMNQQKRAMYPNAQQQKGMNRQGRTPRDL